MKRNQPSAWSARLAEVAQKLQSGLADLEALVAECSKPKTPEAEQPEEYLSLNQLCMRIPYAPQTVRNLMAQGVLRKNEHFSQRRPYAKVVFIWSAMQRWLRERSGQPVTIESSGTSRNGRKRSVP
jgi:hypothetical protein